MKSDYKNEKYKGLIRNNMRVVEIKESVFNKNCVWVIECCSCGNKYEIYPSIFMYGSTHKCNCNKSNENVSDSYELSKEDVKRLKRLRRLIMHRCYNKGHSDYDRYGGRGINVCDDWAMYEDKFIQWAKDNGYRPWLRLKRKDKNLGFNEDNCYFYKYIKDVKNNRELNVRELSNISNIDIEKLRERFNNYDISIEKIKDICRIFEEINSKRGDKYLKLKRRLATVIGILKNNMDEAQLISECLNVYKDKDSDIGAIIENINNIKIILEEVGDELNG